MTDTNLTVTVYKTASIKQLCKSVYGVTVKNLLLSPYCHRKQKGRQINYRPVYQFPCILIAITYIAVAAIHMLPIMKHNAEITVKTAVVLSIEFAFFFISSIHITLSEYDAYIKLSCSGSESLSRIISIYSGISSHPI